MKSLFLIPSDLERDLFLRYSECCLPKNAAVQTCGVGLVASSAATVAAIDHHRPDRVFHVGIGGGLSDHAKVGSAYVADGVSQQGIGIGEADSYQSSEQSGFSRFNQSIDLQTPDSISLEQTPATESFEFLSVAGASVSEQQAERRRNMFPKAILEDMESYSVVHACRIAKVPVAIIRGVSNVAGDRNLKNWNVDGAMKAAVELLMKHMS